MPTSLNLCKCGCGQVAPIMPFTNHNRGMVKGQPYQFIQGHNHKKAKQYEINVQTGCWEWLLGKNKNGYGSVCINNKTYRAHRVYYIKYRGPIPEGFELDHIVCNNRACVNPWHMEPTTHVNNTRRAVAKLAVEQVIEIKNINFNLVTKQEIANKFGVHRTTVSKIIMNENWRDIDSSGN